MKKATCIIVTQLSSLIHTVRQKAKDITSLLLDDARLKEERHKRTQMRDRMSAVGDYMNETILDGRHANGENMYERPGYLDEDGDLRKAIEESKRLAQEEARNRNQG
jgi:epsin